MPSKKYQVLKVTTTGTFKIETPDKLNTNTRPLNPELNRAVLEKLLPQFAGRRLDFWICPYLNPNLRQRSSSNHLIETS